MNHHQKTLADLNRSIELNSNDPRSIARRGETYRLMEHYEEALRDFHQAVELVPTYAWAIAHRGETYRLMQRYPEALADFNQAIELDPTYAWAMAHRGVTYRLIEAYDKALGDFSRAIELNPTYAWAFAYRARTYELIYRYEETLADFDRAIALDETILDNWRIKRAMILSYVRRYAEAITCCQQVLLENPEDSFALYNMAVFKVRWQGLAEAQADLHKARSTLQSMVNTERCDRVLYRLGGLAALEGNIDQALSYLKEAILVKADEAIDYAPHDVAWLDLRSEPRFRSLIGW